MQQQQAQTINQMVKYKATDGQMVQLDYNEILRYVVSGSGQVPEKELYSFMMKCKSRGLNPVAGDAYLVMYGGSASIIVSKDYFVRTAQQQETFAGYRAGIVVRNQEGSFEYREGTLYDPDTELLFGGWAEVNDTRFKIPMKQTVGLNEYKGKAGLWSSKPATMIRKVALVQALREAYPISYGGIYDADEMPEQYQHAPVPVEAAVETVAPTAAPAEGETYYEDEEIQF